MLVHLVSSGEHLGEVLGSDVEHDGETDGGPKGVSSTNPVPEFKHVIRVDSEFRDSLGVGRESAEVLGDVGFLRMAGGIVSEGEGDGENGKRFTSEADLRNHSRADSALVMVSWVVKVFEATMKSVVSGLQALVTSAM